ncbi:abortive infection family protein [Lactiplantibacillus plantarum]|jgi:hypothetical protein|uniref:Abortive infection protein-like C-terminal domain-containing protein n=3 Tax=Lactiplantibacillus plantarum TaxID=1590 RepID=A0AAW3RDF9_LACPN|nr:abortive infection family protein [Lactiplantibacillus plantarum]MBJ7524289.1 abortive infection family protein [Lactobacillus sp. CRM56-2]ARO09915.1 hypothetical protein BIZ34_09940 [Lactiplantibacillus plantarum]ASL35982.1 hypothetical protein CBI37_00315 [Lactiplantibacillus plantarum]ASZ32038.1 hypothetical protein CLC99_01545 [Lactiplantibacillus plantarum]AWY48721.1 hypothetical protein CFN49_10915 [Lactiplantibacillus plantarum]
MRHPSKILRPEVDSFGVEAIDERYSEMNDSYNEKKYGESVNYARSMVESTCKWIFKTIKGYEIDKDRYHLLPELAQITLHVLESELSSQEHITKIFNKLIATIVEIGSLRNSTSVSHGSSVRTESVTSVEARFVIFAAEDITLTLLDLLFNKTHSLKRNAVHSVIDPKGMTKLREDDSFVTYKLDDNASLGTGTEFTVFKNCNVIYQAVVTLPKWVDASSDQEFMSEHMRDYMENDAIETGKKGISGYMYYSAKKDFMYEVQVEGNVIYITNV